MLCLFETGNRSSSFVNQVALILTLFAAFYYLCICSPIFLQLIQFLTLMREVRRSYKVILYESIEWKMHTSHIMWPSNHKKSIISCYYLLSEFLSQKFSHKTQNNVCNTNQTSNTICEWKIWVIWYISYKLRHT